MERPTCGFRGRTTGQKSRPGHGLLRLRPRLDARVRTALPEAAGLAVSFPPPAASLPAALTAPCRPMTPAQALRPVTLLDNCLPDIYTWALHGDLRVSVVTMKPTIASRKTSMIPSFKQLLILCLGVAPPAALIACLLGPPPVSDGTASLQGPDSEPTKGGTASLRGPDSEPGEGRTVSRPRVGQRACKGRSSTLAPVAPTPRAVPGAQSRLLKRRLNENTAKRVTEH